MAVKKKVSKRSGRSSRKKAPAKRSSARVSKKAPARKAVSKSSKSRAKPPARKSSKPASPSNGYEVGALALRLGLGVYFLWVGLLLALNNGFQEFFSSVLASLNASPTLFQLAFIVHLVLGFCLILGLFTRYAGLLASIITLVALFTAWDCVTSLLTGAGIVYMIKNLVIIVAGFSLYKTGSKEMFQILRLLSS